MTPRVQIIPPPRTSAVFMGIVSCAPLLYRSCNPSSATNSCIASRKVYTSAPKYASIRMYVHGDQGPSLRNVGSCLKLKLNRGGGLDRDPPPRFPSHSLNPASSRSLSAFLFSLISSIYYYDDDVMTCQLPAQTGGSHSERAIGRYVRNVRHG